MKPEKEEARANLLRKVNVRLRSDERINGKAAKREKRERERQKSNRNIRSIIL